MSTKKYWKSLEDLNDKPSFIKGAQNEFAEEIPMDSFLSNPSLENTSTPRRDFLKFLGFSVTAASLAACETPVTKVIPYVVKPEEITPGVANWYATTFDDGHDFCSILVKQRDGRPIKIEGNKLSSLTKGATNARVQASVLSLYDTARLKNPVAKGQESSWEAVDKEIMTKLDGIAKAGGNIRILSSSLTSPSTKQIIADFTTKYVNVKHVVYDAVSYSGILSANEQSFGKRTVPNYKFSDANVIVGIGADFLGTWLSPVEFASQYVKNRKVSAEKKAMSKHYQFETNLSLTGSNADVRVAMKPSQTGNAVANLYNAIAKLSGGTTVSSKALEFDAKIEAVAKDLWANKGKSLVVCGSNDTSVQVLVNGINTMLANYDATIDFMMPSNVKQSNDGAVSDFMKELKGGQVGALLILNSNPAYTMPAAWGFADAMKKAQLTVSFASYMDETASACNYVCPDHHYLESWGDANPKCCIYTLTQPVINPLFNTRSASQSFMKWTGIEGTYQSYVKSYWEKNIFTKQTTETSAEMFWTKGLHDGIWEMACTPGCCEDAKVTFNADVNAAAAAIAATAAPAGAFEIMFYEKVGIGNGNQANNPWLQEMPDPISKVVWDNYITMAPADMKGKYNMFLEQETMFDVVELTVNGVKMEVPVFPQPGQPKGTIGLALGYGRTAAGKTADNVGVNAFAALAVVNGNLSYSGGANIGGIVKQQYLATTQTHHTMMGREMVRETSLAAYQKNQAAGNEPETFLVKENGEHVKKRAKELDLWAKEKYPAQDRPGYVWGMAIDLNSCIGCGNCVVSCQAENNVAVVGKDEVRRSREMHWIRIDRYYSSDATKENAPAGQGIIDTYAAMEIPSDMPQVHFMPVMCQHCNHAPCETVCPVIATTHTNEGLNSMTYNRCVGTKYCANNCPYKVRRYNWLKYAENARFDYNQNNDLGKMVLNPDVTVRSRGVMEKCSMCVQRIQESKLNAKKDGRRINDGEIQTACSQSCPTNAITFGNVADPKTAVGTLNTDKRMYSLLEELNTQPSVFYLTKVKNVEEEAENKAEGEKKEEAKAEA